MLRKFGESYRNVGETFSGTKQMLTTLKLVKKLITQPQLQLINNL
jgi:hypothetical protein